MVEILLVFVKTVAVGDIVVLVIMTVRLQEVDPTLFDIATGHSPL